MILVPEAINPERVISYAMQNCSSNPVHPAILVSTLREVLVMSCKIVRPPSSNTAYPAILVPRAISLGELLAMPCKIVRQLTSYLVYPVILVAEAINPKRVISYTMQKLMTT